MTAAARLRLLAWLSPAFPVGAFSYSHGLERAVHDGLVSSRSDLAEWIETLLCRGSGWNDAVLLCDAWRVAAAGGDLASLTEFGAALAGSRERHSETVLQGQAFLAAAAHWPGLVLPRLDGETPYCVAVGAVAGANDLAPDETCAAFLHAFSSNLLQAAIRLSLIGQTDAVATIAVLEPVVLDVAERTARSTLDDLGTAAMVAEIASMRHETQHSRLFRS